MCTRVCQSETKQTARSGLLSQTIGFESRVASMNECGNLVTRTVGANSWVCMYAAVNARRGIAELLELLGSTLGSERNLPMYY